MRVSRRTALLGVAVLPGSAYLARWPAQAPKAHAVLYDERLNAGRMLASSLAGSGLLLQPMTGDRIRQARKVVAMVPASIAGISRFSDALLIRDVARDAGYRLKAEFAAKGGRCMVTTCPPSGYAHESKTFVTDPGWPTLIGSWLSGKSDVPVKPWIDSRRDSGLVLGWILVRP